MSFFVAFFTEKKRSRVCKIAQKKSDLECAKLHRKKAISSVQNCTEKKRSQVCKTEKIFVKVLQKKIK